MITYELAKRLKDAGFPQNTDAPEERYIIGKDIETHGGMKSEVLYIPTLSELIEAIGTEFDGLRLIKPDTTKKEYWFAEADSQVMGGIGCDGATPEEAMSNLYLALHAK